MVVEKGFKTSDVGIIPVEWDTQKLVDLTKLFTKQTGFDYSAYIKPALVQTKSDETIPFIQNKDFNNKWINFKTDYFIPLSVAKQFPKILLDEKSLLISISGSIGNIGVYESEHLAFIGGAVAILKFKDPRIIDWVMFFLKSSEGQKKLFGNVKAGSHQNLILDDIRKVTVPLPLLSEQTAIATALSDMDALIAQTEKLIEKKKAIKQGVMQELLRPKEGWVTKKLGETISEFQNGYGFSAAGYISNGIPIVTMAQIGLDGSFNFDENKVNKWIPSDFDDLKNYHLKNGDLIIAMTDVTPEKNLIGRMSIVETHQTLLLNQRVGLLRLDTNKVNPYFLKVMSNMKEWRKYCIGSASLGVQANIGTKDITNGKMIMPSIEKQNEIAEILIDMDNEIQLIMTKLQKLKNQKQGMMQALLTGKIRLV